MWAFNGDVYDGLRASTLNDAEIAWAQQHVLMLSGLYGVLRPLDRLQPYRLEMGTGLATGRGNSLYAWWGATVAAHINKLQAREREPVVINLASQEYFKVTQAKVGREKVLRARVVECVFEEWKDGDYKIISFFAKARPRHDGAPRDRAARPDPRGADGFPRGRLPLRGARLGAGPAGVPPPPGLTTRRWRAGPRVCPEDFTPCCTMSAANRGIPAGLGRGALPE